MWCVYVCTHTTEYHLAISAKWMDLESSMGGEISQRKTNTVRPDIQNLKNHTNELTHRDRNQMRGYRRVREGRWAKLRVWEKQK